MNSSNKENGFYLGFSLRRLRPAGLGLIALLVAAVLPLSMTTSARAATALIVGGISESTLPDSLMKLALNGRFTGVDPKSGTSWKRISVDWPAQASPYWGNVSLADSVAAGTDNLYDAVFATPGPKTLVGASAGSLVVNEVMRRLADDPARPQKSDINFVLIADGSKNVPPPGTPFASYFTKLSGYTLLPLPETQYDGIVVTHEYDGFADFPDRWWNLVAVVNAIAGVLTYHNATYFADLSKIPKENITRTVNSKLGVTEMYLIPAERLPLVVLNPLLASSEKWLKGLVDSGYSRNDPARVSSSTARAVATPTNTPDSAVSTVETAAQSSSDFTDSTDGVPDASKRVVESADEVAMAGTQAEQSLRIRTPARETTTDDHAGTPAEVEGERVGNTNATADDPATDFSLDDKVITSNEDLSTTRPGRSMLDSMRETTSRTESGEGRTGTGDAGAQPADASPTPSTQGDESRGSQGGNDVTDNPSNSN